jgi:hypothetical protein
VNGLQELIQLFGAGIIDKVRDMSGKKEVVPVISLTEKDFKWMSYSIDNETFSCVRCEHEESGAVAYGETKLTKTANKKLAFKKLTEHSKFTCWLKLETLKKMRRLADIEIALERQFEAGFVMPHMINTED